MIRYFLYSPTTKIEVELDSEPECGHYPVFYDSSDGERYCITIDERD